jgi:hypothetical protein
MPYLFYGIASNCVLVESMSRGFRPTRLLLSCGAPAAMAHFAFVLATLLLAKAIK